MRQRRCALFRCCLLGNYANRSTAPAFRTNAYFTFVSRRTKVVSEIGSRSKPVTGGLDNQFRQISARWLGPARVNSDLIVNHSSGFT